MAKDMKKQSALTLAVPSRIWLTVGALAVLLIAAVGYSFQASQRIVEVYCPLGVASTGIMLETAQAHLWLEEILAGDEFEDRATVWKHLDVAQAYCVAMRNGGEVNSARIVAIENLRLSEEVEEVAALLGEFRHAAELRLAAESGAGSGTDSDQRFDALFSDLEQKTKSLNSKVVSIVDERIAYHGRIQFLLVLTIVILALLVTGVLAQNERRRAADLLNLYRSERRFKLAAEGSLDGLWIWDARTKKAWWSDRFKELLGYESHELPAESKTWIDLLHPDDREQSMSTLQESLEHGGRFDIEYRMKRKDSRYHWYHARGVTDTDVEGDLIQVAGSLEDIHERKQAEEALHDSEERFRTLFHNAPLAYQSLNAEGEILEINDTWSQVFGYSREEILNRNFIEFLAPGQVETFLYEFPCFLREGEIHHMEFDILAKDGRWVSVQVDGKIGTTKDGVFERTHCILTDISERKKSEKNLRFAQFAVDYNSDATFWVKSDGSVSYVNDAACAASGYSREEILAMKIPEVVPEFALQIWDRDWEQLHKTGSTTFRTVQKRRDGSSFPVEVLANFLEYDGEEFICAYVRDITDRENSAQRLRRYQQIVSATNDLMAFVDRNFVYQAVNDAYAKSLGKPKNEIVGHAVSELKGGDIFDEVLKNRMQLCFEGESIHFSLWRDLPNVGARFLDVDYYPSVEPDGSISGLVVDATDITDRVLLEQERVLLATAIEQSNDTVIVTDQKGTIEYVNAAFELSTGYGREAVLGKTPALLKSGEQDEEHYRKMWETISKGKVWQGHFLNKRKDGSLYHEEATISPIKDAEGEIVRYIGVQRDVTEIRKKEKERLLLATAVEHAVETIIITDPNAVIQYVNKSFERISGYTRDEVLGKNMSLVKSGKHDAAFYEQMWSTISAGNVWEGSFINKRKDGALFEVASTISPVLDDSEKIVNFVEVKKDVTRERELEHQLRHSQKMEAVGTLAGGIAHDFNNILQCILGHSDLALHEVPRNSMPFSCLMEIRTAGRRASKLVSQILAFSRSAEEVSKPTQLQSIITEALQLLRGSLPSTIVIRSHVDSRCGPVLGDATQIHQVIMNLCTNAAHAMGTGGGTLEVNLDEIDIDSAFADQNLDLEPGPYARVLVKDTGVGMDETTVERVFEPYFTTKERGEGTGMGLSTVHGIINNHRGAITVESTPHRGSTFTVYIPLCFQKIEEDFDDSLTLGVEGASGRILFVDDEEPIVAMSRLMLESWGYQVSAYTSSVDALANFRENPDAFDVVITDLTMPNVTGIELAKHIHALRPQLPILLCTGYAEQNGVDELSQLNLFERLQKPVDANRLAEAIGRAMDPTEQLKI